MDQNLEEIIRNNINIKSPTSNGWQKVYCEVCGDGSRSKGPRGGWMLNGDTASYHCFNCGIKAIIAPPYHLSKTAQSIIDAFLIPNNDILALKLKSGQLEPVKKVEQAKYSVIPIPDYFVKLTEARQHPFYSLAVKFLKDKKCIDHEKYDFYLSTGKSKESPESNATALYFKNRLIIPAFSNGEMIYYQGRCLVDSNKKYVSVNEPKLGAMYYIDRLHDNDLDKLFITEGFFDAFHLNGVAVMENYFTSEQVHLLNKSKKRKIVVPDRIRDSTKLLDCAVENNWEISMPPFDNGVNDITDCVKKNGRPYTIKLVLDNIYPATVTNVTFLSKYYK